MPGGDIDLNGISIWYEFTDTLGMVIIRSYANAEDEQKRITTRYPRHEDSVRLLVQRDGGAVCTRGRVVRFTYAMAV